MNQLEQIEETEKREILEEIKNEQIGKIEQKEEIQIIKYYEKLNLDLNKELNNEEFKKIIVQNYLEDISKIIDIQHERVIVDSCEVIEIKKNNVFQKEINEQKCYLLLGDFKFKKNENVYLIYNKREINLPLRKKNNKVIIVVFKDEFIDYNSKCNYDLIYQQLLLQSSKEKEMLESNIYLSDKSSLSDNIYVLNKEKFISHELCDELISYMENNISEKFEKWAPNFNVNCRFISFNANDDLKNKYDNTIFKIINSIISFMFMTFDIKSSGDCGYTLRKIYGPTRVHSDGIRVEAKNNIISSHRIRNFSVIICLNSNYEEGHFFFPKQNKLIKLEKGEVILFPPYWTHPHMVLSPTKNTYRYTLHTWLFE